MNYKTQSVIEYKISTTKGIKPYIELGFEFKKNQNLL